MSQVKVIPFHIELSKNFYEINYEWLSEMFVLEQVDKDVLLDPQSNIIERGGQIWLAEHSELGIVGSCALIETSPGEFELTKMGVLSKARGLGIGKLLMNFILDYVKFNNLKFVYLLSSSKCEAAIPLYEKSGFEHDTNIMERFASKYNRCDVAMKLNLSKI